MTSCDEVLHIGTSLEVWTNRGVDATEFKRADVNRTPRVKKSTAKIACRGKKIAARSYVSVRHVLRKEEVGLMSGIITSNDSNIIVWVRRQWNDHREAAYRLSDMWDFHWSRVSGGVRALAPREFVHARVMCDAMIKGELAHSCRHGEGPHLIKVCITKTSNTAVWPLIQQRAGLRLTR